MAPVTYDCAFCGVENDGFADPSGGRHQTLTEDCTVCCRPNLITFRWNDDGDVQVEAIQEYDA